MQADQDMISKDRMKLQNPYVHEDENGGFAALVQADSFWRGGNPYASLNNHDDIDEVWPSLDTTTRAAIAASPVPPAFIHPDQRGHQNPYALIDNFSDDDIAFVQPPILNFGDLLKNGHLTNDRIEIAARQLAHAIYKARYSLFPEGVPDDPVDFLNPKIALHLLGYQFEELDSMGEIEPGIDVAGIIDQDNKRVSISKRFSPIIRNYTAAHEIGHVLMHKQSGLHRDKPIDSSAGVKRDEIERQADYFAACFLMPKKLLEERFYQRFANVLDSRESLAFLLNRNDNPKVEKQLNTKRGLARALAGLSSINGHAVMSLAEQFKVSVEAMAIRLEQLELVPE
jgi:Zn-dependent peptidase ImmA (M78 family)